ncbi:MAG: hypothetical protein ABUK17_11365, partial [Syntrophobacteria bacterium]
HVVVPARREHHLDASGPEQGPVVLAPVDLGEASWAIHKRADVCGMVIGPQDRSAKAPAGCK